MKAKYLLEQLLKKTHETRMAQKEFFKNKDRNVLDKSKKHEKELDSLAFNIRKLIDTNQVED